MARHSAPSFGITVWAALAVVEIAAAQSTSSFDLQPQPDASSTFGAAASDTATTTVSESRFVESTAASRMKEVQLGQLAVQKGVAPSNIATAERSEHDKLSGSATKLDRECMKPHAGLQAQQTQQTLLAIEHHLEIMQSLAKTH